MRADLRRISCIWLLAVLCLGLLPCAQAAAPAGNWWNTSYNYRRIISLPAGTSSLPSGIAVSVVFNHASEVSVSRSLTTGNDVRIVRWTGSGWTELDRIADADTAWNTATTRLWFKTATTLNANVTDDNYYIYYNNPAAGAPPATAENIFLMYDDFTSAISTSRWSTSGGTPAQAGGILQLNTNGILAATSSYAIGTDTIWETRASLSSTYGDFDYWGATGTVFIFFSAYLGFNADSNSHQALGYNFLYSDQQSFTPVTPTSYQVYAFTREGSSTARFLINGTQVASLSGSEVPTVDLRARMENNQGGGKMSYDWVRVRNYRNPDPTLALGAADPRVSGVHHFTVVHDRQGINCVAETIVVNALDASNNAVTTYNQQITLDTGTAKGTWSKVSGSGTFTDALANDGLATYQWPTGESSATFTLYYPEGVATFDIDAYQTSGSTPRDDDSEGTISFSPSGFTITSAKLANPPPNPIPSFTAPTAGSTFALHIAAYGQTPTDATCGIIEEYVGNKTLGFSASYLNPTTANVPVVVGTTSLPTNGSSTNQTVSFSLGQASVSVKYKDVGNISIGLRDASVTPAITGTGNLIVKPSTFVVSGLPTSVPSDASGTKFVKAGAAFPVTITARDADGDPTANFGKETPAQSVTLTSALVAPTGGTNPSPVTVTAPTFNNGSGTGSYSWAEVGVITLTPQVAGGSYLGSGNVIGTTSSNVGRFYPAAFTLALANVPTFQPGCAPPTTTSAFTYMGTLLNYSLAPRITATARAANAAASVTTNYTGAFMKLTGAEGSIQRSYSASGFTISTAAPPAAAITDLTGGKVEAQLNVSSGVSIDHTSPRAPFDANLGLAVNLLDSDGVTATASIPVTGGIGFAGTNAAQQRYGRIALRNASGSEMQPLAVPLRVEYYLSDSAGFVTNQDDNCTTAVTLGLSNFTDNLSVGETCVINGSSCAPTAPASLQLKSTASLGDFNVWLSAPGGSATSSNNGRVTITATVPTWLQHTWNSGVFSNPSGIATFGTYQGSPKRIYQREQVQ